MPTVQMIGHQLSYPVSDLLRLFYGPVIGVHDDRVGDLSAPQIVSCLEIIDDQQCRVTTSCAQWRYSEVVTAQRARREIKRQLYLGLSLLTGLVFPWGSLTGVRPTQVAAECLQRGRETARAELIEHWFVSPGKADLAIETAEAEAKIQKKIPPGSALVYVGVPFCPSRCAYCSFIAQDAVQRGNLLAPYVDAVIAETEAFYGGLQQPLPVAAIYVGGGTPTSLPDDLFARLLRGVLSRLPSLPGAELTVEAGRPDTVTPAKLAIIQAVGATRLCINPQTFHDATLERIGRRHTTAQSVAAFKLARSMGFTSINMDLIAGLPGETPADFAESLRQALDLGPDSITIHTLAMKRSSRLSQESRQAGVHPGLPNADLAFMLETAAGRLKTAGLLPYYLYRQKDVAGGLENTGFARPGEGCLYNVGMMSDAFNVVGLGSGSTSKHIGHALERLVNPKDIAVYISKIEEITRGKIDLFTQLTQAVD